MTNVGILLPINCTDINIFSCLFITDICDNYNCYIVILIKSQISNCKILPLGCAIKTLTTAKINQLRADYFLIIMHELCASIRIT